MVRETRYLYVGNLPDPVTEEQITEYFGRHGRIQSVKLIPSAAVDNNDKRSSASTCCAVVAFMDIRSASRAHESDNIINGARVITHYNESSSAVTCTPLQNSASTAASVHGAYFVASSRTLDSCSTSSSKPGCLSPTASGAPLSSLPMVQAAVPTAAAGPPGCNAVSATVSGTSSIVGGTSRTHSSSSHAVVSGSVMSGRGEGTNGPLSVDHDSLGSSVGRVRTSRRSSTPTSPHGAAPSSTGTNSHRTRRPTRRTHRHYDHHHRLAGTSGPSSGSTAVPVLLPTAVLGPGSGSSSAVLLSSSGRPVTTGSSYHPAAADHVIVCRSRSGSLSPPDTGRSRSQGSSCSGSHSHDVDGDRRLLLPNSGISFHSDCHVRTAGSDSSGVSSSGSNGGGGSDPRKPRGMLIRGFPHRSTDSSIRDGLFHEYKKYGKVTSVSIVGTGDERHAIVSFKKHEDAVKALEASHEKRFFGSKVAVSIHDGVEVENCEFRAPEAELDEYHHKATRTLFVGNLDKSVAKELLRDIFTKFGHIVEIEIKNQSGQSLSYAFIQFDNIRSVVTALREMDGEHVSGSKIKLGFGKSMQTTCVWLDGVADTVSEKYLFEQFYRHGNVTSTYIDRKTSRGLVFFESVEQAQRAVTAMRGVPIKDKCIQIDFASRDCQNLFFENMERTGQLRPGDRADDRAARGYTGFTEYQRRPNPNRRSDSFLDGQRPNDRFPEYNSSSRALAAPGRVYGTSRNSSRNYLTSAPSTPTGTRPDSTRGPFYDGYDRRESSVASTRGTQKYSEDRTGVITPDEVNFVATDAYEQDLKDYGYSQRLDDALDRRKLYRSADSPGGVPHVSTVNSGNGRFPNAVHDDVFIERLESKSQPEWECNSRGGHKTTSSLSTTKVDDRLSSRTQRSYSPSDSDTVSLKSRTVAPSRSRTSQSISPLRHRHSKERKDQSPARDYSWQPEDYQTSTRRSSKESPDRFSTRSAEPSARSSSSFNKGHSLSGVENVKLRTRGATLEDDPVVSSDRDRIAKVHRTMTFEDYTVTVSNDGERRRLDKDIGVTPVRTDTVRSVVNLTPTWRYETDYKTSRSEQYVEQPILLSSNHIGVLSRISRPDRGPDAGSGSSTPRSKSPTASDAEESGSGERTASKGSGDEVASLEKEKYHLLSMLKELEEYSSGGSEMDGRDEVSRAALIRMRMEEVIDLENESADHRPQLISDIMQRRLAAVDGRSNSNVKYDTRRKLNTDVGEVPSTCQRLGENHIGAFYDGEDEVVDLVSDSPGLTDVPSEFNRRRLSSEMLGIVINSNDRSVKDRRSYRTRWSGESAESASEESCVAISPPGHNKVILRPPFEDGVNKTDTTGRVTSLVTSLTSIRVPASEEHASSIACRVSSTGSGRKGSCASTSDHQPCIIPDSLVTTCGSNVRVPTEPRTVQSSTSLSGMAGRIPMSLPLPRFAYEMKLGRQNAASALTDCLRSVSKDENAVTTSTCVVVDVRQKEDVLAPFSPGLLSPTVTCLPVTKTESVTPTAVVEQAHQAMSQDIVIVKDECVSESNTVTDLKNVSESEQIVVNENSIPNNQDDLSACKIEIAVSLENSSKCDSQVSDNSEGSKPAEVILPDNNEKLDQPMSEQSVLLLTVAETRPKAEVATSIVTTPVKENHKDDAMCVVSDSDVSDLLSPGSPPEGTQSLEERIRALDEKLNIYNQKTRQVSIPEVASPSVFDYREKYPIRRRLATGSSALSLDNQSSSAIEQSDIVKSLLSRKSIFDQDSHRLEQLKNTTSVSLPSSLLVSDPMSSSLLVPQSRLTGARPSVDPLFSIPLSHSIEQQRRAGMPLSVRTSVTSDLHLSLPSPLPSVVGWTGGVASNSGQTPSICDSASSASVSWAFPSSVNAPVFHQSWSSPLHVGCPSSATPQTPTSQDPTRPPLSSSTPSVFCSTPTGLGSNLAPTDPRRAMRQGDSSGLVQPAVRRQDSHSTETCDAWSLASPINRRDSVNEVPTLPYKPKEMVSPPVSILKKTAPLLLKEDSCSSNSKSCDTTTAVEMTLTPSVTPAAGVKRTAEVAFGKDSVSSLTPVKAPVKNQKLSGPANKESEQILVDKKHSITNSKTSETKKAVSMKSSSASSVKVDSKKPESLFSTAGIKVESYKSHTGEEGSKSSASKTNKSHSNSSSSVVSSSKKESKSIESVTKDLKLAVEKSSDANKDLVVDGDISKEDKLAAKSSNSNAKPRTNPSKDVPSVKDKDKPVVDKERIASDEKEKLKSNHNTSRHSSIPEHRHNDKSRDKKLDDGVTTSKHSESSGGTGKSTLSKNSGSSTLSRSSSKPSSKETPKSSDKPSNKTKESDINNKDVSAQKVSTSGGNKASDSSKSDYKTNDCKASDSGKIGEVKALESAKSSDCKDKKTEKDDASQMDKTSRPSGSSSKSGKLTDDSISVKSGKSGSKEGTSSKSKHSDSKQSAGNGKQALDKSDRKSESNGKDKTKKTSSSDKSSKSIRRNDSSTRSKSDKRPEEKREVKALLQEFSDDMLPPYQSMYDMVKRRSCKEREKENVMKTLESRAKSLSRIAKASQRRITGSNSSRNVGSSDDETSRSDRSRRRSAESSRASGSAKQSASRLDSSSDSESSDSESSASSNDSDVRRSRTSKSVTTSSTGNALKSHSHVIMSSSDSHDSSDDNDDHRLSGNKSRNASSNKVQKSSSSTAPSGSQRTAIYTSSSSSSNNSDEDSHSASASKSKKHKSGISNAHSNKSSTKKMSSSTPKKQVSSRTNSSKGSAIKKKQTLKDSSSSSASDSEDDSGESSVDRKRKPVKGTKSIVRKTPNKSAVIESSASDSDSDDVTNRVAKKTAVKSLTRETEKVSANKVTDAVPVPAVTKDSIPVPQSLTLGKTDSKPLQKAKEEKDEKDVKKKASVSRPTKSETSASSSKSKKPSTNLTTVQLPGKTAQEVVNKPTESGNKVDEKGSDIQITVDPNISKAKQVSEKTLHTAKSGLKIIESEVKLQSETPTKSLNEQQKLTSKKKTSELASKPPSKKCKVDISRASVHHSTEAEREESAIIRTDNIFEKMEKPEIIDKVERELDKFLHHPEPIVDAKVVAPTFVTDTANLLIGTVKSEVPVFLPADEDRPEPSVEMTKLTVERLKEESSKEQTIEEAVKTIMDLAKDQPTPSVAPEEAASMRQVSDMDSSSSMIEEANNGLAIGGDTSLSDDAGELNAAIESLLEKELEPTEDISVLPLQQDTKSIVAVMEVEDSDVRQELVTEECYDKLPEEPEAVAEQKDVSIIGKEEESTEHPDKAVDVTIAQDAVEVTIKSELDSSPWNLRNQQPSDENVMSFMTRLSKATADIVTDFGALRKTNDEGNGHKTNDLNIASTKLDQSSRLFGSLISQQTIPQPMTDLESINGIVPVSFLVKKEIEILEPPVEAAHENVKSEILPSENLQVVPNLCETDVKSMKDIVVATEDKISIEDDARSHSTIVKKEERKEERNDPVVIATSTEDLNTSADLYEFKDDDDEEVKHPLHKRSRKRPGDSDSSETGLSEATPEPKRSRRRANSATAKVDASLPVAAAISSDTKAAVVTGNTDSTMAIAVEVAVENSPPRSSASLASPSVVAEVTETIVATMPAPGDNESWQAHMDSVIDAVARGNFERGDESDYYATTAIPGSAPAKRQRTRRTQAQKTPVAVATASLPVAPQPPISAPVQSTCFASGQQGSPSMYNTAVPPSFVLTSIGAPTIQRSLASVTPSGKASPKIVASQQQANHSSQIVMPPQRMYAPVSAAIMVSACGPTLIGGALSPGSNGGPVGYHLMMTRPIMNDGQGHQFVATSVVATQEQQRRLSAAQHQLSPPGSSAGHGVMDMSLTQPLLVTVSRAGLGAGATPSPVIPMDTGHPQVRGVVPQTAAVLPPSAPTVSQSYLHGVRLDTGAISSVDHHQTITNQGLRPQFGIASIPLSVGGGSASNAASLRFSGDAVTAGVTKVTAPLDVMVTTDVVQGKVRHTSPDLAQGLLQSIGQFSPRMSTSAYMGHIGRPLNSFSQPQPNFSYGVIMTPQEAATVGPRHSSPIQSDLREALQQPSRLIQQEQLLQKQKFSVAGTSVQQQPMLSTPMCSPQSSGGMNRTAIIGTAALAGGSGADICSSQISLGQHRMPFTVTEPRTAVRAEPKSLATVNAQASMPPLSSPVSTVESSLTGGPSITVSGALHRQMPPGEMLAPHSLSADLSSGGGSVAGRMEPPRSASAMLSHGVTGAAGAASMDFFISQGVVAPRMLSNHPFMVPNPQQQQDVAMHRYHQRPGLVFVPGAHPHTQCVSVPTQQAASIIGPPPTTNMTDIQQTDNLVVNTKQFTDALQRFQSVWHGHLVLKNDIATVSMHFIAGNQGLIPASLPLPSNPHDLANGLPPQLRIGQRMRLDPSQLDQVSKRMLNNGDFSMLLAVPSSRDAVESMTQTHTLQTGFINYLLQKQAAGIVNIQDPTNNQAAYVVHIFPPCSFSEQNLNRFVPDIVQNCAGATYLMIVITTC